jgi:addiction module HigA family antidote
MGTKLAIVHPGEVLREEYLVPMRLTFYAVAAALGVSRPRVERLTREATPVIADTALRLAKHFKTCSPFRTGLQRNMIWKRLKSDWHRRSRRSSLMERHKNES